MATILLGRHWKWIGHVIRIDRNSITTLDPRRKTQAWQAEKHMEAYCRRRDEDHEQRRKDGQGQTEMEDLCCCPTCQRHIGQ
jgi:hypothetical protein